MTLKNQTEKTEVGVEAEETNLEQMIVMSRGINLITIKTITTQVTSKIEVTLIPQNVSRTNLQICKKSKNKLIIMTQIGLRITTNKKKMKL